MLIAEYFLREKTATGTMPENPALVETIVTTDMAKAMAASYGVALIEVLTEYIVVGVVLFKPFDLLSDILKSGQHLDQLHVVGCRNRFCHISRHDRLHERRVLRHGSHRCLLS